MKLFNTRGSMAHGYGFQGMLAPMHQHPSTLELGINHSCDCAAVFHYCSIFCSTLARNRRHDAAFRTGGLIFRPPTQKLQHHTMILKGKTRYPLQELGSAGSVPARRAVLQRLQPARPGNSALRCCDGGVISENGWPCLAARRTMASGTRSWPAELLRCRHSSYFPSMRPIWRRPA